MPSQLVQTADAVTSGINGATFSCKFTAERRYADFDEKLENLNQLRVDVVPVGHASAVLADRGNIEYRPEIDIVIRYRFGAADDATTAGRIDNAAIDEYVLLVEEIVEFFASDRLADFTDAVWQIADIRSTVASNLLREHRQFFAVIRLTFDVTVALT